MKKKSRTLKGAQIFERENCKFTSWSKRSQLEESFNQEIEELSQETENLVSDIEKWQRKRKIQ